MVLRHKFIASILVVSIIGAIFLLVFRKNFFDQTQTSFDTVQETAKNTITGSQEKVSFEFEKEQTVLEEKEQNETQTQNTTSSPPLFNIFGKASIAPDALLDGKGKNIDSPEFFETDDYRESLLLVSGKGNNVVEVWKYPFKGNEQSPLQRSSSLNGLAIDQKRDWLIIGDSEEKEAAIYTLPGLKHVKNIGQGILGSGETNGDVLTQTNGGDIIYMTESHRVRGFDPESGKEVVSFSPLVESIEEVLVDDYYTIVYVPDENGGKSKIYPGGAVTAYTSDGKPFLKNGTNILAQGVFSGDGEGAALYKCLDEKKQDTGHGFLIFVDQGGSRENGLEFFNRETWKHLGALSLSGVSQTDGIASTQLAFPEYPRGILAAHNNDKDVALVGWDRILTATKLTCD